MEKQRKPLRIRLVQYCLWGIAGFLAVGLMLPFLKGFSPAMQRATQTHASSTAYNLKNALSAFFTEYRKFPVPDDQPPDTQLQTDHALMDALLGADIEGEQENLNPEKITFYSNRQAKSIGNGRYRNGLTINDKGQGELWDPWGNHYRVALDLDGDGQITNVDPRIESKQLPEAILIWSAGPDGDFDTWKDNITTW